MTCEFVKKILRRIPVPTYFLSYARSLRVSSMNKPVSFLKAAIGRELTSENFYQTFDDWSGDFEYQTHSTSGYHHLNSRNNYESSSVEEGCSSPSDEIDGRKAAHFNRQENGSIVIKINKELQKDFEVSLQIRTFDQDGMLFAAMVRKLTYCNTYLPYV